MKTITTTHPAALGFLAALFSFTLLAPSAAGQENVKATCFTIESNKAQSILLDTTTLEAVDLPVYTGKGNCEIHKATDSTQTVWSQQEFSFLEKPYEGNYTVHPSLWNNGRNSHLNGVFRVHDDMPIFQVRGYDMANITFVYTSSGWLIFDTLMSGECTEAAVALFNDYLTTIVDEDGKPYKEVNGNITAVFVSHSHIDHYGGLQTLKKLNGDSLLIYAPKGFEQHSVSENLYAGTAMARRASYQYGTRLEAGCCGRISIGIGQGQSKGTVGYLRPTHEVDEDFMNTNDRFEGEKTTGRRYLSFGNVRLYFQLTPGTEAPAEMNNYLEFYKDGKLSHRALWMAENCNGTLHNLYTLRGAQVRDAKAWADFLMQTLSLWPDAEAVFQAHNWPRTGRDTVGEYLFRTAAAYKFLNDQCLLYMNQGFKPDEIAEKVRLPKPLECTPYLRPYYGTLKHNARAVYQRYLGWYDANPVHLDPLPEQERAGKYASLLLRPAEEVIPRIKAEYEQGNYRFVADVCYQLLLGKAPDSDTYRMYLANSLQQLGYLSESGIWRNSYLSAAKEVRQGGPQPIPAATLLPDADSIIVMPDNSMMRNMSYEMLLDYLAIVLDTDKASALGAEALWSEKAKPATTDFYLQITPDSSAAPAKACFHIWVKYGVLLYQKVSEADYASGRISYSLGSEDLYTLIANIGHNEHISKKIKALEKKNKKSYDLLQQLFCYMVNINRYGNFDIMQPAQARYIPLVKECVEMLESYYDSIRIKPCDEAFTLSEKDKELWNKTGRQLVDAGIISDLYFFSETPETEYKGIGFDRTFYKYQYCETLYECYKYLTGNYVPDSKTQFVKFCIDMTEPYANRFRRKPGEVPTGSMGADFYPFDKDDRYAWDTYCKPIFKDTVTDSDVRDIYLENIKFWQAGASQPANSGIGEDGLFFGSELLHFLYRSYRFLYINNSN